MGFLSGIFNSILPSNNKVRFTIDSNFGTNYIRSSQLICPYCRTRLTKEVKAKTKCKNCGEYIYRRTHPYTKEGLTLTNAQVNEVELEWARVNGTYEEFVQQKEEFDSMKSSLSKRFGKSASDNDVQWALQNKRLATAMQTSDWGEMSSAYLQMGVICFKEKRFKDCIINYSLCGNCATREHYQTYMRLGMDLDKSSLKSYHYLDSTPARDSLVKLGLENQLGSLISIVQNMELQPSEVVKQVELILNT